MERYLCIHGHFYQPPRENPWLEAVELQDSAYPYHDWNERVTAECYGPNSTSRILNGDGRIEKIVNNYKRISFNFGPTLLSWLEEKEPEVYQAILEADRESRDAFSGHGSALAQGYNHLILPLANRRDKHTQVLWGIRDFERRFGRKPEGMWLPETAVDIESLQILKKAGIRFTILAPHQAGRVRKKGSRDWQDVSGGRIDSAMPYELRLPSGQKICLFFYDGPISRAVAFEGLLGSGELFAGRLLGGFPEAPSPRPVWSTSPPTGRRTATTTGGERWPSPSRCSISIRTGSRASRITESSSNSTRRPMKWRSSRTPPGAASTGSNGGAATAAAIREGAPNGTRNGAPRSGRRWTDFGTISPPDSRRADAGS